MTKPAVAETTSTEIADARAQVVCSKLAANVFPSDSADRPARGDGAKLLRQLGAALAA